MEDSILVIHTNDMVYIQHVVNGILTGEWRKKQEAEKQEAEKAESEESAE